MLQAFFSALLKVLLDAFRIWKRDQQRDEALASAAREEAEKRQADAYRETTQRMQNAEPDHTDPDAIRARLRNRPRDTR